MIRIGHQKGRLDFPELRRIGKSLFFMTLLMEILFALIFLFGRKWFPTLYLDLDSALNAADNAEVIAIAAQLLLISAFFQISDGLQAVILGALRGLQDVRIPTLITFIAYWIIGFPISYYLGIHTELKSMGIWIGLLSGLTASAIMLYLRFEIMTRRLIRTH